MSESFDRQEPRAGTGAPDRTSLPEETPRRPHVLIVDDHALSADLCAGYCDLFDHTSHAVDDPAKALAAMRREPFSVVVINVHMDEHASVETVRAIRQLPGDAGRAPIIGLTDVGRDGEAQRWLAAGLDAVLAKPVTARRLFAALSAVIDGGADSARSWAPAG